MTKLADNTCMHCGYDISPMELHHYGWQCETCVRAEHKRIREWQEGKQDRELDERYGPGKRIN